MTSYLDVRTLAVRISARKESEAEAKELGRSPSYQKYRRLAMAHGLG